MARTEKRQLIRDFPTLGVGTIGWVKRVHGGWALFSAEGEILIAATDRSHCFFGAVSMGLKTIILH